MAIIPAPKFINSQAGQFGLLKDYHKIEVRHFHGERQLGLETLLGEPGKRRGEIPIRLLFY